MAKIPYKKIDVVAVKHFLKSIGLLKRGSIFYTFMKYLDLKTIGACHGLGPLTYGIRMLGSYGLEPIRDNGGNIFGIML